MTAPIPLVPKLLPAGQCPSREDSGSDRPAQHQDRAALQRLNQSVLGHRDSDPGPLVSVDRRSARGRLRAAGLDRPTTRSITGRKVHGTDQRLEHPPGAVEEVAGDHFVAAVTAATAPRENPKAAAAPVDEPPHRAATGGTQAVDPDQRSGHCTSLRDPLPDPDRDHAKQASDRRRNPKAEAALERLKEKPDAKNQIRDEARGEAIDETAERVADCATDTALKEKPDREKPFVTIRDCSSWAIAAGLVARVVPRTCCPAARGT